ncbi:MAG: hypothetical protein EOP49_27380 [Sphingobacteriales bacterium]|nr:MAG: hypothetical protein EOP49_27380 [Sphingobacteriales bacterium]
MRPGTGPAIPEGSFLATSMDTAMVVKFHNTISPLITNGIVMIRGADSAMHSFNYMISSGWGTRTQQEVERFNKVLGNIAHGSSKANEATRNIGNTLRKADSATHKLAAGKDDLNIALREQEVNTSKMSRSEPAKGIRELGASLQKFSGAISRVRENKLLSDPKAYRDMNNSLDTMQQSLKEMKENPKGLSIFGKKQ